MQIVSLAISNSQAGCIASGFLNVFSWHGRSLKIWLRICNVLRGSPARMDGHHAKEARRGYFCITKPIRCAL